MNDVPGRPDDLGLVQGLRRAIEASAPLALLDAASAVLAASDPRPGRSTVRRAGSRPSLADLITSFSAAGLPETDALLRVWSHMIADEATRSRLRDAAGRRSLPAPGWLDDVGETRPVRAVSVSDLFGENETIFIEISTPVDTFTLAAAVFHCGPLLEDAYAIPLSFARALVELDRLGDPGAVVRTELSLANTRARVEQALSLTRITIPPIETDSWPATGPLLTWMLRLMPEGGRGYERSEPTPEQIDELLDELAASPHGVGLSDAELEHAAHLFELQCSHGTGDPLRWGPRFVERLMCDLYQRRAVADEGVPAQMPRALRAVVRFANERSGIPRPLIDDVLRTVDECEEEYLRSVEDDFSPFRAFAAETRRDPGGRERLELAALARITGGPDALEALDADPLPGEQLRIDGLDDDVLPAVRRVAEHVVAASSRCFGDPELTTVALRVLARVAAAEPAIFRRRAKVETAAAAVCWIAGRNNDWFTGAGDGSRTVRRLMRSLGLSGSPTQRAETMLRALQAQAPLDSPIPFTPFGRFGPLEAVLGDPELLTSSRRREIIEDRDRLRARLDQVDRLAADRFPPDSAERFPEYD